VALAQGRCLLRPLRPGSHANLQQGSMSPGGARSGLMGVSTSLHQYALLAQHAL